METRPVSSTATWLVQPAPRPEAAARLLCLPYGGGGAAVYRPWSALLPAEIELNLVQLPGRESRLREQPHTRLQSLLEALTPAVMEKTDRPYALFGHCMGALIVFELARALRRMGAPAPAVLFVSGRRAPHLPDPDPPLHPLADVQFLRTIIRRYNGIPRVILEDAELLRLFLPTLRADMELIETHTHAQEAPLNCPIVALGGIEDARAGVDALAAWHEHTSGNFQMQQFPGDHFYLQNERDALIKLITAALHQSMHRVA